MGWTWNASQMGKRRTVCKVSVKKPEAMRAFGRPRRRRKDNIKWIFKKSVWKAWIGLI
jgi:hypothetical protein